MIEWCGRARGWSLGTEKPAETILYLQPACQAPELLKLATTEQACRFFDCTFTLRIVLFVPFFFFPPPFFFLLLLSVGYCFCDERQFPLVFRFFSRKHRTNVEFARH